MRDKEPQFTVTDRRKFTAEGELREGETASESSAPPAVAERAKHVREPAGSRHHPGGACRFG